ncbi:MAG TPA: hypothetical protein VGX76_03550, partial [Pirellulales bacterium]|nr:hypothetical protein [Pirellulales bacterium]
MECPQCQSPIEADASGEALTACPACGAAIPSATGRRASRGRLMTILLSLVLVAMATISVGSTVVAVRMAKERAIARQNFSDAQETIDKYTTAVLANDKLKGNLESARKEMLKPALDYYQKFVQTNSNDESALRELTAAQFRLAALQAKAGSKSEVPVALNKGIAYLKKLDKTTVDPQTFPSLQNCAMKLVPPAEWVSLQNISPADMLGLTMAVEGAIGTFGALAKEHPQVISFRDD